jgi:hypothetical protein
MSIKSYFVEFDWLGLQDGDVVVRFVVEHGMNVSDGNVEHKKVVVVVSGRMVDVADSDLPAGIDFTDSFRPIFTTRTKT